MQAQSSSATAKQPAHLSRYRSVRKALAKEEDSPPPVPEICSEVVTLEIQVKIAPSRYRRATKPVVHDVPLPSSNASKIPTTVRSQAVSEGTAELERPLTSPSQYSEGQRSPRPIPCSTNRYHEQPLQYPSTVGTRQRGRTVATPGIALAGVPKSYDEARLEARMILDNEQAHMRRLKEQQEQTERERRLRLEEKLTTQTLSDQTLPEPRPDIEDKSEKTRQSRRWVIGRSSQSSSKQSVTQTISSEQTAVQREEQPSPHTPMGEEIRKYSSASETDSSAPCETLRSSTSKDRSPTSSKEPKPTIPAASNKSTSFTNPHTAETHGFKVESPPRAVDVPVSAVNAGERRVKLRMGSTIITLPVHPSTTARDLLNSASVVLSQPIDPRTSVLVEIYKPLDLERPLRHYEHVRYVMNSWDDDAHNHLRITHKNECAAVGLHQNEAPSQQPGKAVVNLYHSQRPSKWEKRCLILSPDGQVTVSKDEHDRNARNIFHLSDFDVYMPTEKQIKKMKSPKRNCFAVKSQQRSVVFENTINFVHFFSASDKIVADRWYHAIQSWRSWYLANVLQGSAKPPKLQLALGLSSNAPLQKSPSTPRSVDTTPYQLGTFKPLLDFSADAFTYGDENTKAHPSPEKMTTNLERRLTTRQRTPPYDFKQKTLIDSIREKDGDSELGLTGKGLLGRHFEVTKAQSMESTDSGFTGRGLLSQLMNNKQQSANDAPSLENTNNAFTGLGLLSRNLTKKRSQPVRAGQPLVSLSSHSEFMNGSLLQQVEAFDISHGAHLPVIDRSKGIEVMDRTGEF